MKDSSEVSREIDELIDGEHFSEAIKLIHDEIALNGRTPIQVANLALCFSKTGQLESAISCFSEVLKEMPDMANVIFMRGNCYLDLDLYCEARADFNRVLSLDPNTFDAHVCLGVIDELESDNQAASANYRRALEINPDSVVARARLRSIAN